MATLVEVLAEFFRSFGYTATLHVELPGTTGRRHAVPLLLEKDARRLGLTAWLHRQPLGPAYLQEFTDSVKDCGLDGGLVVSLGAVPEPLLVQAAPHRVQVWDSLRTCQELGSAVLRETCPDGWQQSDPWHAPRPSRIVDQVHQSVLSLTTAPTQAPPAPSAAPPPAPAPAAPGTEPAFAAAIPPSLASPATEPATTLQLPLAFGILDQAVAAPTPPAPPEPHPPTAAPAPALFAAAAAAAPPPRPTRNYLRLHVSKGLAASLAKPKTRTVDRLFLRLVPYHVFDYEASILVEGSLQAEKQTGRMCVDASLKRVRTWSHPLDTGDLAAEGADVDEKPVRIPEDEARKLVSAELRTLVTRDVVMQEDESEWSVMVKKKVSLAEEELRLTPIGVYWIPIWRVTGRDGSVEIDAATGQVLHEEISTPKTDAVLI